MTRPGVAEAIDLNWPVQGPSVVRIREDNPGMFTGPGTNSFLIGDRSVWLLDPGEDRNDGHHGAILEAIDGRPVEGILYSHGHRDHWPLGERLATELGVRTYAFAQSTNGFEPSEILADAQILQGDGFELECLHTPGHCADHLSFALRPRNAAADAIPPEPLVIFCGDHVMAWSTTILAPPDGSLNQYLDSLDKLLALAPALLLPAHGPEIWDPLERITELREHRLLRTQQLLEALTLGPLHLNEAVKLVYTDIDQSLFGAAAASLKAHVDALLEDGHIEKLGARYQLPAGSQ